MESEEVNWDKLDKKKFFGYGAGMFSCVTTLLFPLAVVKTRQMALPGVAPGFKGTAQTVTTVWRTDGIRGFYSGFGTVLVGTIPGRVLYLTALEASKSAVGKVGQRFELSEPTLAGVSNFAGGAAASLATQSLAVPIDVVSQRQMVYSGMKRPTAGGAAAAAAADVATACSTAASGPGAASSTAAAAASSGGGPERAAAAGATASVSEPSAAQQRAATQASTSAATHKHHQPLHRAAPVGAISTPGIACPVISATPGSHGSPGQANPSGTTNPSVPLTSDNKPSGRPLHISASLQAGAASQQLPRSSRIAVPSGLQIVRSIVATEGVRGLYRGFGLSVATFVPSSAVWWSAYGTYQKLLWQALVVDRRLLGGTAAVAGGVAELPLPPTAAMMPKYPWGQVLAVQTMASVGAGMTAAMVTNPLDLIKTRIQVSEREQGRAPTFRLVLGNIIKEDGFKGLWRGVFPRIVSAALWGTCMVNVYEFLKRIAQKTDSELADMEHAMAREALHRQLMQQEASLAGPGSRSSRDSAAPV